MICGPLSFHLRTLAVWPTSVQPQGSFPLSSRSVEAESRLRRAADRALTALALFTVQDCSLPGIGLWTSQI